MRSTIPNLPRILSIHDEPSIQLWFSAQKKVIPAIARGEIRQMGTQSHQSGKSRNNIERL